MPDWEWPLAIDGAAFERVPLAWLDARSAYDAREGDATPLFAVSQAVVGDRLIRVRYGHPLGTKVAQREYRATFAGDLENGPKPAGLVYDGWPRSIVPERGEDPAGVRRQAELEWLLEAWEGEFDDVDAAAADRREELHG